MTMSRTRRPACRESPMTAALLGRRAQRVDKRDGIMEGVDGLLGAILGS
jgi:hypothetical protein